MHARGGESDEGRQRSKARSTIGKGINGALKSGKMQEAKSGVEPTEAKIAKSHCVSKVTF
jgi:hypothetical protein